MSEKIITLHNTGSRNVSMDINDYYGGQAGTCIQLTAKMEEGEYGYVQLSPKDIEILVPILQKYAESKI